MRARILGSLVVLHCCHSGTACASAASIHQLILYHSLKYHYCCDFDSCQDECQRRYDQRALRTVHCRGAAQLLLESHTATMCALFIVYMCLLTGVSAAAEPNTDSHRD
jgi:hypothetical protein